MQQNRKSIHTEQQVKVLSLCPNVLLLLHSLFNEYSEIQINTDRTAAKRGGGAEEMAECGKSKGRRRSSRFGTTVDPTELFLPDSTEYRGDWMYFKD